MEPVVLEQQRVTERHVASKAMRHVNGMTAVTLAEFFRVALSHGDRRLLEQRIRRRQLTHFPVNGDRNQRSSFRRNALCLA